MFSNPYFASALSILAERPRVVARIFARYEMTPAGLFSLYLNQMGEWKNVIIDDSIPFNENTNNWAFTRASGPELWPLLIEKAFAKMYGCYENIQDGFVPETIMDLIGAPYDILSLSGGDEYLWNKMKNALYRGQFVFCSKLFQK